MEQINEHEIDGLIQTMRETGIKGLMKYTDVLVLNHMMERGWIPPIEKRDELIKTLKGESDIYTMSTEDTKKNRITLHKTLHNELYKMINPLNQ